jgi:hypothetical protein
MAKEDKGRLSHGVISQMCEELLPGKDTSEVLEMIEKHAQRPITKSERRTIIVMCSRLRTWGKTQYVAPPPEPPVQAQVPKQSKRILALLASRRKETVPDLLFCLIETVIDEDLLETFCPPTAGGCV